MTTANTFPSFNPASLVEVSRVDDAEIKTPARIGGLSQDPRTVRAVQRRRMARMAREQAAAEHIGRLPEIGEDLHLVMAGTYHGFDLFTAIIGLAGDAVTVEDCYIATLGFNRYQTKTLAELLDAGRIERLTFIVSDMFTEKNEAEFQFLSDALRTRGQRIANTRNHAKLMLLRLSDGRHIVTHGSLNLRRCNSFEQICICQDAELYRFFQTFLEDCITGGFTP